MRDVLNRIALCSSEESFKRLSNSVIREMYLIGYKQTNGFIWVAKNRFNGEIGTHTKEGWDELRDQTIAMFDNPDMNDLSREELIGQIMYLRKKIDRLENSLNEMSWRLNPDRMGGQFSEWETNRRGDEWS